MNDDPKAKNEVSPEKPGGDDRSPARAKDRERDHSDEQKQPGNQTDEINSAEADEDTYD